MTNFDRLQIGFTVGVVIFGFVLIIGSILQAMGISNILDNLEMSYIVPFMVSGYVFAPDISKYIKMK